MLCAFCGAANSVARTVTTLTLVVTSTVAMAFPAHIARLNWLGPAIASTSEARPAPSFAATRGATSLPYAVAAITTSLAPTFFATSAAAAECVSASACSNEAPSTTCTGIP